MQSLSYRFFRSKDRWYVFLLQARRSNTKLRRNEELDIRSLRGLREISLEFECFMANCRNDDIDIAKSASQRSLGRVIYCRDRRAFCYEILVLFGLYRS